MLNAHNNDSEEPLLVSCPPSLTIIKIIYFQIGLQDQQFLFAVETIHCLIFKQVFSSLWTSSMPQIDTANVP